MAPIVRLSPRKYKEADQLSSYYVILTVVLSHSNLLKQTEPVQTWITPHQTLNGPVDETLDRTFSRVTLMDMTSEY